MWNDLQVVLLSEKNHGVEQCALYEERAICYGCALNT